MKILLIEDDIHLCGAIKETLSREGHLVDACHTGDEGILFALSRDFGYEIAVIDRMLPFVDGLTIVKAMREKGIQIPVILITAMSGIDDRIEGLDNGADDYLIKPFHIRELSARIRALGRRPAAQTEITDLKYNDITLSPSNHKLTCYEREVILTPKEFLILHTFMKSPETLFSRDQLIASAWEADAEIETGNLDNYIYFLRKRLRSVGSTTVISSVYGSGYLLARGGAT